MIRTKETLEAIKAAGELSSDCAASEPDKIPNEDLGRDRVRQSIVYTRQDVSMLVSLLASTHDKLVQIRGRLGVVALLLTAILWAVIAPNHRRGCVKAISPSSRPIDRLRF